MIKQEKITIDGVEMVRTFSDSGKMVLKPAQSEVEGEPDGWIAMPEFNDPIGEKIKYSESRMAIPSANILSVLENSRLIEEIKEQIDLDSASGISTTDILKAFAGGN